MEHHYSDLITIFNQAFYDEFNTRLELGAGEPIYLPADNLPADNKVNYHRILFANGYYASALHELAHWCVAGAKRREQEDYGYWYQPDGRTAEVQQAFEAVEVRPQAYEWILSVSAGFPFTVSCDNLHGDFEPDRLAFMQQVYDQVVTILSSGLPPRLLALSNALRHFYSIAELDIDQFDVR